ncbi:MAG: hypothetical protein ACRDPB_06375, partial [Nocardioidaceae bacterium]
MRLDDDQSLTGTTHIDIEADTVDALAFDKTIGDIAEESRLLGDDDTLDVRRAKAVGTIADPQSTLDLLNHDDESSEAAAGQPDASTGSTGARATHRRSTRLVVYLHLHQAAITGQITAAGDLEPPWVSSSYFFRADMTRFSYH